MKSNVKKTGRRTLVKPKTSKNSVSAKIGANFQKVRKYLNIGRYLKFLNN